MRISTEEEAKRFEEFNNELTRLNEISPLVEINANSPQSLQVITFHLVFEYLIEKWIDHRINHGNQVFKGIEKIGFHNKMYIAKNIGMPKSIFLCLSMINNERNLFAHQITKKSVGFRVIEELSRMADEIDSEGTKVEDLAVSVNGVFLRASDTSELNIRLHIALHALMGKLRSFVFFDIYLSTSKDVARRP